MASVAPAADETADLLQTLTLETDSKTIEVPEPAKKSDSVQSGPVFSTGPANGIGKPFNPNACFIPNGYPSNAYCYTGFDSQGNDWNAYSGYMNIEGGMAPGVYGDSCSYVYHPSYGGYINMPYGAFPPPSSSSAPSMQHDGQLYGMQQYQYPTPYYQSPTPADGLFAPNNISATQGKISTSITADHVPSSVLLNKGSTGSVVNGDNTNTNEMKSFLTTSENSSLSSNDSHQRPSMPSYAPLSGYQGPQFSTSGTQSTITSDASLFSDRQSKHGGRGGFSSPVMPAKGFSTRRNQNLPQPLPQFTNLHGSIPSSRLEQVSGFMSRMYPSSKMYNQYGNIRAGSHFGSAAYGSRMASVNNKLKYGQSGFDHSKKNGDGFDELNKGPRAKGSYSKNGNGLGTVALLLKGQDSAVKSDSNEVRAVDSNEVRPVPNKEEYNGTDFSVDYSNARIFVIKSYSEDDIHKSIKYNVWASTPNGNKKLDAAYQEVKEIPGGCPIFLLFSVNTSGQFVGLAEMAGPVDFDRTVEYWQQDRWTGCFPVQWRIIKDIPNSVLRHITLENNENKPVTNSRDTQEVKFEQGIEILKIFKEHSSKTCILDDFGFYESREKIIQGRKSKEQLLQKQVSKPSDFTTIGKVELPKSLDGAMMNQSASVDAAADRVNGDVKQLEENGTATADS